VELEELGEPRGWDALVAPDADCDDVDVDWIDAYEY
jgi:hypothetical protein